MKKIGVILSTTPQWGGQHQYAMLILECLLKYNREKYEIEGLCGNRYWTKWCKKKKIKYSLLKIGNESDKEIAKAIQYPFISKLYYTFFSEQGRYIRRQGFSLLINTTQTIYTPNYMCRVIQPVHDLMHIYESSFAEVRFNYEHREIVLKSIASFADVVLVDSKLGRTQFRESYKQNRKMKVAVLPFAICDYIEGRKEEYIEVPEKYIFYPAQFWKHKNHINLLKAMNILRNKIPDIKLVLAGSEKNGFSDIKKYISENHLEDNVKILGYVTNENITYLYKHAIGMVMPSFFGPTNIPPLEAMALGCPVAVSNNYAMCEQVGNAGLLFSPYSPKEIANCIEKMWTNQDLREDMIKKGYIQSQKWNREKFEKKLIKIIDTMF